MGTSDRMFTSFYNRLSSGSSGSSRIVLQTLTPTMSVLLRPACLLLLGLHLASLSPSLACRFRIPPHDQVARVARFVAHQCDWASMATVSSHKPVVGQPFSNVFSVSDGPPGSSSGVPYMYLTRMEISVQDLEVSRVRVESQFVKLITKITTFKHLRSGSSTVQNYVQKSQNLASLTSLHYSVFTMLLHELKVSLTVQKSIRIITHLLQTPLLRSKVPQRKFTF